MYQTFRPLLEALKQRGADPQAVDRAAEEAERTGRSIRAVLINDHVVTETQLTEASADAYGIQTIDLVGYPIDPAAVTKIPLSVVLRHRVLGIALTDDEIIVGITDPGDVVALDDVRAATGIIVRPVVVARSELRKVIDRLKREENDLGEVADEPARRGGAVGVQPDLGRRRRADRALRQLTDRAGHPEPRVRPAPGADRARHAGAVPASTASCTRSTRVPQAACSRR